MEPPADVDDEEGARAAAAADAAKADDARHIGFNPPELRDFLAAWDLFYALPFAFDAYAGPGLANAVNPDVLKRYADFAARFPEVAKRNIATVLQPAVDVEDVRNRDSVSRADNARILADVCRRRRKVPSRKDAPAPAPPTTAAPPVPASPPPAAVTTPPAESPREAAPPPPPAEEEAPKKKRRKTTAAAAVWFNSAQQILGEQIEISPNPGVGFQNVSRPTHVTFRRTDPIEAQRRSNPLVQNSDRLPLCFCVFLAAVHLM